jgi:hypothetical protein
MRNKECLMERYVMECDSYAEFYNSFVEMLDLNQVQCYLLRGLLKQAEAKQDALKDLEKNGISTDEAIKAHMKFRIISA